MVEVLWLPLKGCMEEVEEVEEEVNLVCYYHSGMNNSGVIRR